MDTDRTLYFVTGRDAFDNTVWGGHFYAADPTEVREIAAGFMERDRRRGEEEGRVLPSVTRLIVRKSKSYANAMN